MRTAFAAMFAPPLIAIAMVTSVPAAAQDFVKVSDFPPVTGYLGDGQPDGVWGEIYDDRQYKFFGTAVMDLNYDEMLILDVMSYEYQPIIYLQDNQGTLIDTGTPIPPRVDPQNGLMIYTAHLEHRSVYQGRLNVFIRHSTYHLTADQWGNPVDSPTSSIAQGNYYLVGSLWRGQSAPTASTPSQGAPASTDGFDMQCTCLSGNGRTYRTVMGNCPTEPTDPNDPAWCQ